MKNHGCKQTNTTNGKRDDLETVLNKVCRELYPEGTMRTIWKSVFAPKICRLGAPRGFLKELVAIRGSEKLHKFIGTGLNKIAHGAAPIQRVATAPGPGTHIPTIYLQGSGSHCVVIDRDAGIITKTFALPDNEDAFRMEAANLSALGAARVTSTPAFIGAKTLNDGTIGLLQQQLVGGRPVPVQHWLEAVEKRVIPAITVVTVKLAGSRSVDVRSYVGTQAIAAIRKGHREDVVQAVVASVEQHVSLCESGDPTSLRTTLVHHDLARHNILATSRSLSDEGGIAIIDWANAGTSTVAAQLLELERQTLHYAGPSREGAICRNRALRDAIKGALVRPENLETPGAKAFVDAAVAVEPLLSSPRGFTIALLVAMIEKMVIHSPRDRKLAPLLSELTPDR